jgi:hypothetical protein
MHWMQADRGENTFVPFREFHRAAGGVFLCPNVHETHASVFGALNDRVPVGVVGRKLDVRMGIKKLLHS